MAADSIPQFGGSAPGPPRTSPLIDVAELAAALRSDGFPVLLDVRWSLAGAEHGAFLAGHIPGAVFVDLDRDLADPPGAGGRHPLPDPAVLAGLCARAGITGGSTVVVCGQRDTSISARAWWLLRWTGLADVRVLDGGFEAWRDAGMPVEAGARATSRTAAELVPGALDGGAPPGDHAAPVALDSGVARSAGGALDSGVARSAGIDTSGTGAMPTVDADGAAALGDGADTVLLDARAAERYRGEVEPVDPVGGHIPGAVNVPLGEIHGPDGRLLAAGELRARFRAAGITNGTAAAASCGSGVTACSLILAAEVAGLRLALYPGSYSGWCALGRPVEVGP